MSQRFAKTAFVLILSQFAGGHAGVAKPVKHKITTAGDVPGKEEAILWRDPADIENRDLYYGPGGQQHQPRSTTFQFTKEDLDATNPKFNVRDADGVKWKLKLGDEAKPETTATRLVWAAGYFTDEDYFLPQVRVEGLPQRVHRGQNFIGPGGTMSDARLERELTNEKKLARWRWSNDPFTRTREWNGLRVMMALVNNWDLKDENNSIYRVGSKSDGQLVYVVSDLGASFGPDHIDLHHKTDKGDLQHYRRTTFIRRTRERDIDFSVPGLPSPLFIFNPVEYIRRARLTWIGRHIPRSDAHWIGTILARLSARQIRDAFRAGGYSPEDIEGFAAIVERRIASLTEL